MSAVRYLHRAVEQIALIARDIELDMDEGLDHKGAYMCSVNDELKRRVADLLTESDSVEWDLHDDDLIDKAIDNDPNQLTMQL